MMGIILTPRQSTQYIDSRQVVLPTEYKRQLLRGITHVEAYRTQVERSKPETLTISGLLDGSEVRVIYVNSGEELVGGVESSTTPTLSFSYMKPQVATVVRLLVLLAGYKVISSLYTIGLGDTTQSIFYTQDPTYIP